MDKFFFEKTFSEKRVEKYFKRYADAGKAMMHYRCNIELAEAFYPCISTFEIALRNAVSRELAALFGRIVMGINDRHLNFRVSVLIDREKSYIYVTTLVQYNNRFGEAYFLLVKPFHNLIVRSVMKRQIK